MCQCSNACPRPGTIYFTAEEMRNLRPIIGDLDNLGPDSAVQLAPFGSGFILRPDIAARFADLADDAPRDTIFETIVQLIQNPAAPLPYLLVSPTPIDVDVAPRNGIMSPHFWASNDLNYRPPFPLMHQEVREFTLGRYSEDRPEMAEPPQQAFMENQLSPIRESFPDFDDYGHSRVRVETYDPRPVPEWFRYRERLPPLEISGDAHQDPYNECHWGHPRRSPAPLPEGARPFSYPLAIDSPVAPPHSALEPSSEFDDQRSESPDPAEDQLVLPPPVLVANAPAALNDFVEHNKNQDLFVGMALFQHASLDNLQALDSTSKAYEPIQSWYQYDDYRTPGGFISKFLTQSEERRALRAFDRVFNPIPSPKFNNIRESPRINKKRSHDDFEDILGIAINYVGHPRDFPRKLVNQIERNANKRQRTDDKSLSRKEQEFDGGETDEGYFGSCSESICSTDSYGLEFDDLDSDVDEPDPVDPVVPEGKVVDLITGEIRDRMKMEDFEDIVMKKYEERWDRLHEEGKTDKIKEYEEGDEEYDFKEWLVVKEERKRAREDRMDVS